jgi:nucleoid-associated protein YgaU
LPGVGNVPKEWAYVGGAVLVGILVWWYKRRLTAASDSTTVTDPLTGLQQTPADANAGIGYSNPFPGNVGSSTVDLTGSGPLPPWGQRATDALKTVGYDELFAANTIGAYLARQAISNEQANAVRTAWALIGHPDPDVTIVLTTGGSTPGGPTVPGPSNPGPATHAYTVVHGDTLESIAGRFHTTVAKLYAANETVIENTAKAHGYTGSDQGHPGHPGWWIFPGTVLHF